MSWFGNVLATRDDGADLTQRSGLDDYITKLNEYFQFGGLWYGGVQSTLGGGDPVEPGDPDFVGRVQSAYKANGIVFAVELARLAVFSAPRFRWQRIDDGKPSDMFATPNLRLLERPWSGGTTQDLLVRMLQDADLAGNAYLTTSPRVGPLDGNGGSGDKEIVRLRPDWVDIVLEKREFRGGVLGHRLAGYLYTEGGAASKNTPVALEPSEVAHFAPTPDPLATFRGMSWLTPVLREQHADQLMEKHKSKFFANGATPNMIVKHPTGADEQKIKAFATMMDDRHAGVDKAYKSLHLYPGADATVVGADMKQIDFKTVQGAGETRIAAAGGVPPVIVGLSEGLAAATYSNYGQARRRFGDGTIHPLWQNAAGSLEPLLTVPNLRTRLWYDASDVAFLREDSKDAAEIASTQAQTIRQLIDAGYKPETVIAAVEAGDWRLLKHSGLYSVQLQKPGGADPAPPTPPALPPKVEE